LFFDEVVLVLGFDLGFGFRVFVKSTFLFVKIIVRLRFCGSFFVRLRLGKLEGQVAEEVLALACSNSLKLI
jgi:hypothetical protein